MRCTTLLIYRYWEKAVAAAKMTLRPFLSTIYWSLFELFDLPLCFSSRVYLVFYYAAES